jgi:hypothetical protein
MHGMPMLIMPIIGIVVPASRHYHRNCVPYDRHHRRPDRDGGERERAKRRVFGCF